MRKPWAALDHRSGSEAGDLYHRPVLALQVLEHLVGSAGGRYLDATTGGGGHLALLLGRLGSGARVLGIDRDPAALEAAAARTGEDPRLQLKAGRFSDLAEHARGARMLPLEGVLIDLGVSSRQLDDPGRGFTYRTDAPLDMRMDPALPESAADLLARWTPQELEGVLRQWGELREARCLARDLVQARTRAPLEQSGDLRTVVERRVKGPRRVKVLSQLFQALRIAVNDEMGELDRVLERVPGLLAPRGRLVIISYHSLEDRRVKQSLQAQARGCICPPDLPRCGCGVQPTLRLLTPRAVMADEQEIATNPRARSARLRAAIRVPQGDPARQEGAGS